MSGGVLQKRLPRHEAPDCFESGTHTAYFQKTGRHALAGPALSEAEGIGFKLARNLQLIPGKTARRTLKDSPSTRTDIRTGCGLSLSGFFEVCYVRPIFDCVCLVCPGIFTDRDRLADSGHRPSAGPPEVGFGADSS
jgi:hypothetical protein